METFLGWDAVTLSRLQFAITAFVHFFFVPLTLGLSLLLCMMETLYVRTGKAIYKQMTQFWGLLFGINFALGVVTGIPLEFQFGTNWSHYAHFVGDVFGALLALEGLLAFFLEATFIGLFFFGWSRLKPKTHLFCTYMMALGTTLSALWILIANAWMNHPVGAVFNPLNYRMELQSLGAIIVQGFAQVRFVHTLGASYVLGAMFVISVSAWYLLGNKHQDFARRSWSFAATSGLIWSIILIFAGDETGYLLHKNQPMKVAALEAIWETEPAPMGFTLVGWPKNQKQRTDYAIKIPWVMGLLLTRSLDQKVLGIKDLVKINEKRIAQGKDLLERLEYTPRRDHGTKQWRSWIQKHSHNLGYGLLLKRYVKDIRQATSDHIRQAARSTVPNVFTLFWSFRIMVGLGFYFLIFFAGALWIAYRWPQGKQPPRWMLRLAFLSLPLPWIASQMGWLLAEYGRQPWTVVGWLPTFLSGSKALSAAAVGKTLISFLVLYVLLIIVDVGLLVKYIRLGPQKSLKGGKS